MTTFRSNKVNKRQTKYLTSLGNDLNIDVNTIETNSPYVFLGNVGLLTGNSYEDIFDLFCDCESIQNVFLFNNRRYSLLKFADSHLASNVVNKFNGILSSKINKVIYLFQIADHVAQKLVGQCQENIKKLFSQQPEGMKVVNDIVNEEDESMLLSLIDWNSDSKVEHLKNRKVKHFGRRFDYTINGIVDDSVIDSIPDYLMKLATEWKEAQLITYIPDQITVNMYEKGQGIPMHIDTHSCCEDEIVSLSLGSDIVMDFERIGSRCQKHEDRNTCCVLLRRRSLLILKDKARYCWKHGIACRKYDAFHSSEYLDQFRINERSTRVSFTFRKFRNTKCSCDYPEFCDSQKDKVVRIADSAKMEDEFVYKVYDKIAGDFDRTRYKPWPRVKKFLESLPLGSILCDIGCGNGKYLNISKNLISIGCDTSLQLLEICRQRKMEVLGCNILNLPFRDSSVDHLICIAVIHHLASKERRVASLIEISRILMTGGTGLIYVWALEQVKDGNKSVYIKAKGNAESDKIIESASNLPVHCNRTEFKQQDLFVPWKDKNQDKEFLRYYHVFRERELELLFADIPDVQIIESYYDQGNWCVIFQKKNDNYSYKK